MDTPQDFPRTVFMLLLCLSPFIMLLLVGGAVAFYTYYTKKKRAEKLQTVLDGVSGLSLPEIETIIESGQSSSIPLIRTLVSGAQQLHSLTVGDVAPLEKRTLNQFVQILQSYERRAVVGKLPGDELNGLRDDDLQGTRSLAATVSQLVNASEQGDAASVHQYLLDATKMLGKVCDKHIYFRQRLAEAGVQFPVPQPVQTVSQMSVQRAELVPVEIIQQLPESKRHLFLMQYNSARKNPTVALVLALLLGNVGAHKFYMGQMGLGILYVAFCWTYIPGIVGIIEAFTITGQVHRYNAQKALEIAAIYKSDDEA